MASAAQATPGSGFVSTQVAKGDFAPIDLKLRGDVFDLKLVIRSDSDIYVTRNSVDIGGQSGWHTHPGPSLITVTIGEIVVYDGNNPICSATHTYHAGEGFVDPGDGHVHLLRNESGAVAETVAVQFLADGAVRRIDSPKPANCDF